MAGLSLEFVVFDVGVIAAIALASLFLLAWSAYRRIVKREEYMACLIWLAAAAFLISLDVFIHELMDHPDESLIIGIDITSWDSLIMETLHIAAHAFAFVLFLAGVHSGMGLQKFLRAMVKEKTSQLSKANAELLSLDRMKSEFIDRVSHETKTPMSVILSSIELLKVGELRSERSGRIVDAIERNAARLRNILERSSDLRLIEHGKAYARRNMDLEHIIEETAAEYRPMFERKGISFSVDAERLKKTEGDPSALKTVVTYLLDNALKFTEKGQVTLSARMDNSRISVSVKDTGVGMSLEEQKHIFKPFYKTRNSMHGASLAICRHIIRAHGGNIGVRSKPGRGSEFFFTLPPGKTKR